MAKLTLTRDEQAFLADYLASRPRRADEETLYARLRDERRPFRLTIRTTMLKRLVAEMPEGPLRDRLLIEHTTRQNANTFTSRLT